MAHRKYVVWDAATGALTGAPASVATGTAIKTLMQLKPTVPIKLLEWGYSTDVVPTALVRLGLVVTDVAGTLGTAYGNADFAKFDPGIPNPSMDLTVSGFNIATEGTVAATRFIDGKQGWAQDFSKQFPWEREPVIAAGEILRIRATTATSIGVLCYVAYEE